MTSTATPPTLSVEDTRAALQKECFDFIADRLVHVEGWAPRAANTVVEQYRNFLFLNKKYGDTFELPPSREIDEAWHAHILHTERYHEFCERVFGRYLHHRPATVGNIDTKNNLADAFEKTQALYKKEFGDYIYAVRSWKCLKWFR